MERIKGANGELMKYSMQPMDGEGHLTLYRYDQLAVGGADNAHLEFWQEIEELRKQRADAQATIAALQADNRTYINERHENMKQIEQLQAMNNRLGVRVETLEAQLTQRTAELEAAKRRVAAYDRWLSAGVYYTNAEFEEQINVRVNQRNALTDLKQQVAQLREEVAEQIHEREHYYQAWMSRTEEFESMQAERDALQTAHTTLRGLVEKANYELAALFSNPEAPILDDAKEVCENRNTADAMCILNAYEAIHEAATLPREGAIRDGGEHE